MWFIFCMITVFSRIFVFYMCRNYESSTCLWRIFTLNKMSAKCGSVSFSFIFLNITFEMHLCPVEHSVLIMDWKKFDLQDIDLAAHFRDCVQTNIVCTRRSYGSALLYTANGWWWHHCWLFLKGDHLKGVLMMQYSCWMHMAVKIVYKILQDMHIQFLYRVV